MCTYAVACLEIFLCFSVSTCEYLLCLVLYLFRVKDFFFVFCLCRVSENGILVQLEEELSVLPRVWGMLLLGVRVIPARYKTSPSGNAKSAKVTEIQLQLQVYFPLSCFLCWRMWCQVAFLPETVWMLVFHLLLWDTHMAESDFTNSYHPWQCHSFDKSLY